MLCKIAELITEVPAAGGMAPRCAGYLTKEASEPEIAIQQEYYWAERWPGLAPELLEYMESGLQFYCNLLHYNGLMLHASAAALGGRAYLFSGPCGRGKSTHTRLWQQTFGEAVQVFNDDKPALRHLDGRWFAYGTPWCGKDGINLNQKWPLGGICFLEKAQENRIRRLSATEALPLVMAQTLHRLLPQHMELLLASLDSLLREIPVFLLENRPEEAAARLSFETMRRAAEEEGL